MYLDVSRGDLIELELRRYMLDQKVDAGSEGANSVQRNQDLMLRSNACSLVINIFFGVGVLT